MDMSEILYNRGCWATHKSLTCHNLLNTLRPRQHVADDTFNCIFVNKNMWISCRISLKFVPWAPNNNIPALVQILACRQLGVKPLSEPMMFSYLSHICVTQPQGAKWGDTNILVHCKCLASYTSSYTVWIYELNPDVVVYYIVSLSYYQTFGVDRESTRHMASWVPNRHSFDATVDILKLSRS